MKKIFIKKFLMKKIKNKKTDKILFGFFSLYKNVTGILLKSEKKAFKKGL